VALAALAHEIPQRTFLIGGLPDAAESKRYGERAHHAVEQPARDVAPTNGKLEEGAAAPARVSRFALRAVLPILPEAVFSTASRRPPRRQLVQRFPG
jgi:hypothetical protein